MRLLVGMFVASLACASAAQAADLPRGRPTDPNVGIGMPLVAVVELPARAEVRIVCLGSSSTEGVGASSPGRTYPARLDALLRQRAQGRRIEIVNKGVGGETVADNLSRIERDVLRLRPDLVIWQVGTNDALVGLDPVAVRAQILDGVRRLKEGGAAVLLMDPQPLPHSEKARAVADMAAAVAAAAREAGAPLFSRHARMAEWVRSGRVAAASLYGGDGLHMTDAAYAHLAEDLAEMLTPPPTGGAIVEAAARRP